MVELLVTYLEMLVPPSEPALAAPMPDVTILRQTPAPDRYLDLYRAIGAPFDWDQRLRMPAAALRAFLESPSTDIYLLDVAGRTAGLCEFSRAGWPEVELTHFGLIPEAQGKRLGPYLLDRGLREIWSREPRRVWLHTDTEDHPKAIPTYRRAGFRVYQQRNESVPD